MTEKNQGWSAEEYARLANFGSDWRDTWWNQDYLELMARRLRLEEVRSVLDVGCGAGHWGQRLATVLPEEVSIVGVDHEDGFLAAARERAAGRPGRYTYQQASAEALPFADDHFDLATCQTVLIHVADAPAVLREMVRVVKPGGLVLASEPNNLPDALSYRMAAPDTSPEDLARLFAFDTTCWHGRILSGHGDAAVGERLPGYLAELGLRDLSVYANDRCAPLVPPYEGVDTALQLEFLRSWEASGNGSWGERDKTARLFEAGGGDPGEFAALWDLGQAVLGRVLKAIDAGRLRAAGGFVLYVVSGRKPAAD